MRWAARHEGPFAYVEVPGRGHAPLLDEPAALTAIEGFLAEHMNMNASPARPARSAPQPNTVLAMLLVVYIFNFVDRQILAILAAPIQAELDLSDGEMGLLGGIAFALLYSTLAVPLAALADRTSRSWVITVSLLVWSGFTAACGLAQGFWHIFLARGSGVGVGEAGGVAPSYALIGDYFPSERRATALSIYSLGIPLGSAAGVLAGGYIAATVDWRLAFFRGRAGRTARGTAVQAAGAG